MTLSPTEARVLLAAAASPLGWDNGSYWRTDAPAALVPDGSPDAAYRWQAVEEPAVRGLANRGLLRGTPNWVRVEVYATDEGLAVAGDLREALGDDRRRLLRCIAEAGELVRRERDVTDEEYCEILSGGGAPADRLVEWVDPCRAVRWGLSLDNGQVLCWDDEMTDLVQRGLVVLLAGGSRAVLSGAGRWCAAQAPDSDSKAGAPLVVPG